MFKKLVLSFFMAISLSLQAEEYMDMSYERFVHLSEKEQNELIILTMEYMAELESKFEKEVALNGEDSDKARYYSKILETLKANLFQFSAYAQTPGRARTAPRGNRRTKTPPPPPKKYAEYSDDFAQLIGLKENRPGNNKCVYAGWVSRTNANAICLHPEKLPSSAPERKAYVSQKGCDSKTEIACNPMIFGYAKAGDSEKSLFCVKAGAKNSFNSSNECMNRALGNPPDPTVDSPEDRLKFLREQFKAKPEVVRDTYRFIMASCVCDVGDNEYIMKKYLERIRPHRTCYGLMKMMSTTTACAEPPVEGFDQEFLKKITNQSFEANKDVMDDAYKGFLKDYKDNNTREYNKTCGIAEPEPAPEPPKPEPPKPKVDCSATFNGKEWEYKVSVDGKDPEEGAYLVDKEKGTVAPKDSKDAADLVSCKKDPACTYSVTKKANEKEFAGEAQAMGLPEGNKPEFSWSCRPDEKGPSVKCEEKPEAPKMKFKTESGEEKEVVCTEAGSNIEEDKPSIKLEVKETTSVFVLVIAVIENYSEGWNIIWTRKDKAPEPTIKVAGDEEEEKPEQPTKSIKEGDANSEDLKSVKANREKKEYEVCAELNKIGEEPISGGCKTIEKKEVETPKVEVKPTAPMAQPTPQTPVAPPIPRRPTNTSAQGIR